MLVCVAIEHVDASSAGKEISKEEGSDRLAPSTVALAPSSFLHPIVDMIQIDAGFADVGIKELSLLTEIPFSGVRENPSKKGIKSITHTKKSRL